MMMVPITCVFFFFNDTATTEIYTLSLHDALPISSPVMQDIWETVSSERHFANAHLEVVTEHVRTPSCSQPRAWTIVHRKAAAIIAPRTRDGKIVLITQERIPIPTAIGERQSGTSASPPHATVDQA